ncbi:hypothetical protein BDV95DRAFT_556044 [Massariosphaeria phaeospora]|uniref:Uncharacterized protein n=1 Tax=Massariosphaeria phaeospora TaxID=100035 RepID=A0A7C8IER7_9PLEO|nr:hypothetical protein BDV95DRAFT_556044 [Massariosphaeria phaeospora]
MYRRSDPRWNRTIQNITDNIEHANESAQENLYSFTHQYINPCVSSVNQCLNACTEPCFPSQNDRRRNRRTRGRAELSFDFYDDWEEDENDGLLGWGNDNLDRLLGNSNNYGAASQPGRQSAMTYGNRNRDARFNTARRKSTVQPRDGGADPTIIPSSSYFGFLGRLPFKVGGKVLRYKPSAADLTEHPGQTRRGQAEEQPLIEESDEEDQRGNERKRHRRQRSHTTTSGRTTDSLSSRGDIFPSEDEDDAIPLDDEFTLALERRTTKQWHDDTSSGNTRSGSKKPAGSRISSRTNSSRNTEDSARRSNDDLELKRTTSETIEEVQTLADLKQDEERLQREEEEEIQRKRLDAQQLALKRGLASEQQSHARNASPSQDNPKTSSSPHHPAQVPLINTPRSPLVGSPPGEPDSDGVYEADPFPPFDPQTMPDSGGGFHVDESDMSSFTPTPNRPLSIKDEPVEVPEDSLDSRPD